MQHWSFYFVNGCLPAAATESDVIEEVLLGAAVLFVETVKITRQFFADRVFLTEFRFIDGSHVGKDVLVEGFIAFGHLVDVLDNLLLTIVVDLATADTVHDAGDELEDELEVGFVLDVADGRSVFESGIIFATSIDNRSTSR